LTSSGIEIEAADRQTCQGGDRLPASSAAVTIKIRRDEIMMHHSETADGRMSGGTATISKGGPL